MKQAFIELVDYNPKWPAMFAAEKQLLIEMIGPWLYGHIEHVGSTAVPGLIAKPVIDIMFGVKSLNYSRPAIAVLIKNGYQYSPYKKNIMHWFCKPSDAFRTHHLHLIPYENSLWKERIQFRELLLSNHKLANDYAILKKELAAHHKEDREAYTKAKWPFIQKALGLATRERA